MRRWVSLFFVALAGCAGIGGIPSGPEVSLADIGIAEVGLIEQRYSLKLRVLNPSDREISIDGISVVLEINGKTFARGVGNEILTVPRFGDAVMEVMAVSNIAGIFRQITDLAKSEREVIAYRLSGRLHGPAFGGLPFDHTGEIALPKPAGPQRRGPDTGPGG